MTVNELKRRFPNASPAFLKANLDAENTGESPIMEHSAGNGGEGEDTREEAATGRLHIRFISVRQRQCDPDNLAVKWLLDALRYAGIIRDDSPDKISLEVTQRRCRRRYDKEPAEKEHTVIEIRAI